MSNTWCRNFSCQTFS